MATRKEPHVVLTVHVTDRVKEAPLVQKSLSKYGDVIRTRLGLHEVNKEYSSPEGIMLLDIVDEPKARGRQRTLNKIKGIESKLVVFKH